MYVVGIIQYWETVLISVLLSSDPNITSCLQEILGFKISSAGRIRTFTLGEEIFPENFLVRNGGFSQDFFDPSNPKISWKKILVRNGLRGGKNYQNV